MTEISKYTDVDVYCKATECGIGDRLYASVLIGDLQEAAEQGDPVAQNKLGNCYTYGWGVEQDYEKAAEYYQLSADQGDPDGTYNLGFCY